MTRRRLPIATAVALGCLAATGAWACGVAAEPEPRTVHQGDIRFGLAETSTSTTTTTTTTTVPVTVATTAPPASTVPIELAKIYLVKNGRLIGVDRPVQPGADLSGIIRDVQDGPTNSERAAGLRTAVSADAVTVLGIAQQGGTATVDVAPSFLELLPFPTEQQLAAGQLVMTLTDRGPGIGRVRFTVGGNAVAVPRGDGSAPQQPDLSVSRDDYLGLVEQPS